MTAHVPRRALVALAALATFGANAAYAPAGGEGGEAQIRFSAPSGNGEQIYRLMQPDPCPRRGDWKVVAVFDPLAHGYEDKGPVQVRAGVRTYLKATWDASAGHYSLGCISEASFVPEAGHSYGVAMNLPAREHGKICPILVADLQTGLAPPSYLPRSSPPRCR